MTLFQQFLLIAVLAQLPSIIAVGIVVWRQETLRKTIRDFLHSDWFEDGR